MPRSQVLTLPLRAPLGLAARLARAVATAVARRRYRQVLARLDAHFLRDIGLSADEARMECGKPFWQP
jgi:uncharacterized protein YjiS (DUF1127 family)